MAGAPETRGLDDLRSQRGAAARRGGARGALGEPLDHGARLLAEARWIAGALAVLALGAVLLSYHRDDPGFTHAAASSHVGNWGGSAGAWIADLLLFLFGFSAGLWVVFLATWVGRGYARLHGAARPSTALSAWVRVPGFALLLLTATTCLLYTSPSPRD